MSAAVYARRADGGPDLRGNTVDRRRRREWLISEWRADVDGVPIVDEYGDTVHVAALPWQTWRAGVPLLPVRLPAHHRHRHRRPHHPRRARRPVHARQHPPRMHDLPVDHGQRDPRANQGRRMTLFGDDPAATRTRPGTPHWSAVAGRTPCDKCVAEALAARHRGDIQLTPNPARWRRVHEGTDMRLCYPHAQPIRATDDDRKVTP